MSSIKQELRIHDTDAHDHCAILLAINPADERGRRQLIKEKEKLRLPQTSLEALNDTTLTGTCMSSRGQM